MSYKGWVVLERILFQVIPSGERKRLPAMSETRILPCAAQRALKKVRLDDGAIGINEMPPFVETNNCLPSFNKLVLRLRPTIMLLMVLIFESGIRFSGSS